MVYMPSCVVYQHLTNCKFTSLLYCIPPCPDQTTATTEYQDDRILVPPIPSQPLRLLYSVGERLNPLRENINARQYIDRSAWCARVWSRQINSKSFHRGTCQYWFQQSLFRQLPSMVRYTIRAALTKPYCITTPAWPEGSTLHLITGFLDSKMTSSHPRMTFL